MLPVVERKCHSPASCQCRATFPFGAYITVLRMHFYSLYIQNTHACMCALARTCVHTHTHTLTHTHTPLTAFIQTMTSECTIVYQHHQSNIQSYSVFTKLSPGLILKYDELPCVSYHVNIHYMLIKSCQIPSSRMQPLCSAQHQDVMTETN